MECQDCVKAVTKVISAIPGIKEYKISLENQSVLVEGSVSPSKITRALRETGRAAILRGSGDRGDGLGISIQNSLTIGAAVCILDYNHDDNPHQDVRGLVRMVQLPYDPPRTFVEVTMASYPPGTYDILVRETGDLTRGINSAGKPVHVLGKVSVDQRGWGEWSGEVDELQVWEVVGHVLSVDNVAGVVARSAGVWENLKKVCACSGRTIWEEHQVMAKQASVL
jgi:copper chaperone for superoxide dismutase